MVIGCSVGDAWGERKRGERDEKPKVIFVHLLDQDLYLGHRLFTQLKGFEKCMRNDFSFTSKNDKSKFLLRMA